MQKNKIKTIAVSGTNQWKDKTLTKHFIQFEDDTNGTLTTGFDDTPPPIVGDEIEYDLVDNGYGNEIKLPRNTSGFKGGAKWTPEQVAQQDAIKLTCAYIESSNDLKFWKQFFLQAKEFMLVSIKGVEAKEASSLPNKTEPITEKLPF